MEGFSKEECIKFIDHEFQVHAIQSLMNYIRIPNLSRSYDPEWNTNGKQQEAAQHIIKWIKSLEIQGLTTEIIKIKDQEGNFLSPIIFTEIKGDLPCDVFYYGHFDKQPPMTGWWEGYGPTTPVFKDGKLYGRGGGDDGYSTYSSMLSIQACQKQGIKIPRCIMITEGDEESGFHILDYLKVLKQRIGNPKIIFCLDSGTLDYDTFTLTTSIRGGVSGLLEVAMLSNGVHSGISGVIPSTFRIARQLLERIECMKTGQMIEDFQVQIPQRNLKQIRQLIEQKGKDAIIPCPFLSGCKPVSQDPLTMLINSSWKAQLSVTGASGFPPAEIAGNVLREKSVFKLSVRLPPTKDGVEASKRMKQILQQNPPYGAHVKFDCQGDSGWVSPPLQSYLDKAIIQEAAWNYFGSKRMKFPEGGSIPIMNILEKLWPEAQYLITGVLGPDSNAHGPNEFLHIPYTKKLTCAMAHILFSVSLHFSQKI